MLSKRATDKRKYQTKERIAVAMRALEFHKMYLFVD